MHSIAGKSVANAKRNLKAMGIKYEVLIKCDGYFMAFESMAIYDWWRENQR